jgi:hypothetical protein
LESSSEKIGAQAACRLTVAEKGLRAPALQRLRVQAQ